MKNSTTEEVKKFIEQLWKEGKNGTEIAKLLSASVWTIRKWKQRISSGKSVESVFGRPKSNFGSSFDDVIIGYIKEYRKMHMGWGAKTILVELRLSGLIAEKDLPSESSIKRIIAALGLQRKHEKHRPLISTKLTPYNHCHGMWQMDDQGAKEYGGVGFIGMINIKDVYSRTYVGSLAIGLKHCRCHPNMSNYQQALRLAFVQFGKPECIQADHGSNFYENRSKSPFPTRLHLWLVGLDITLTWIRIHRPTDQGCVERCHQTIQQQVQQTQDFLNIAQFQDAVDLRRSRLNLHIKCETINGPPLVKFEQAIHSGRYFDIINESNSINLKNVYEYLQAREWFRAVATNKTISLGGQVYYIPGAKDKQELKITFSATSKKFSFHNVKEHIYEIPIKGISILELIG